ncbi:hypothetical protein D3C71_169260 [compost metagenome]
MNAAHNKYANEHLLFYDYPLVGNKDLHYFFNLILYFWLPFALMQKVSPKNQGCINPWLKIKVSVGRKRKLAALRQWFPTLSTEPMILLTPDL